MKSFLVKFVTLFKDQFSLKEDLANEDAICNQIRRNIDFKGAEVWILVFAIFVAAIGLNVNSTPVVIGAMLISPLMGPIMGVGLGVGIFDLVLIKKAASNLAVMVIISVITSAIYFKVSPLQAVNSELLSRTNPTIWDVFIGLFGGFAGIVATSSKERGNVIPGVAIATALMPPLCTAGYGLAIGSLKFFAGAFYLFSINAVFIWLSTLVVVRLLRFKESHFVSPTAKRRVQTMIALFVLILVAPSIFIARNLVVESVYKENAEKFLKNEFKFPETEILKHVIRFHPEKEIEVSLIGAYLDDNAISNIRRHLQNYGLDAASLIVKQGNEGLDPESLRSQLMEQFLSSNIDSLRNKDKRIATLTKELESLIGSEMLANQISREALAFDNNIIQFSINRSQIYDHPSESFDTIHLAVVKFRNRPKTDDIKHLENWLKIRINTDTVKLIVEQ